MAEARSSSVSPTGAGKAYLDRAQLSPRTDHADTQAGNDSAPSERRSDSCPCRIEHVGARQRNLIRLETPLGQQTVETRDDHLLRALPHSTRIGSTDGAR